MLKSQWATYSDACRSVGAPAQGSKFKIARDIFVAKTDEKAREKAKNGAMGYAWQKYLMPVFQKYLMPVFQKYRILQGFIDDSDHKIDIADIDLDYLADNVWLCGSPETVIAKIEKTFELAGFRYGQLAVNTHDALDDPAPWVESLRLFATEVVPHIPVEGTQETVAVR